MIFIKRGYRDTGKQGKINNRALRNQNFIIKYIIIEDLNTDC